MRTLTCAWVTASTGLDGKNGLSDRCKLNGCDGHPSNPKSCPFQAFLPAPDELMKIYNKHEATSNSDAIRAKA